MQTTLFPLFNPRSVAVVGASRRPDSVGGAVLGNLLRGGFQGSVYPVNPNADQVHSVRAYKDLRSLPEVPDLVIVAIPARRSDIDHSIDLRERAIGVGSEIRQLGRNRRTGGHFRRLICLPV